MGRIFKTTWNHIRRSPYQALAAVGTIALVLFVSALFIMFAAGFEVVLKYFESKPQITVFLKDPIDQVKVDELKLKLLKTGKVREIKYVSKEEALEIYKQLNKDNPLLLEMVTASILPASLEISTKEIGDLSQLAQLVKNEQIVEEISFQEDIVELLQGWTRGIRSVGIFLILALDIFSLLIILIIMGMKISLRKMEIGVMRLIGAAPPDISYPFLLEGVIYGLIGGFFAWLGSYLLVLYSTPFLVKFLAGIPLLPVPPLFLIFLFLGLATAGVFIGGLGSLMAVRRYLSQK